MTGSQPTDTEDYKHGAAHALVPTLVVSLPHVCLRKRDRTVSIGSHMQQNMDISQAPPHRGTPFPLLETVHIGNLDPKIGVNLPSDMAVLGACYNACFSAPPGARQSSTEAGEDDHATDSSRNFFQHQFSKAETGNGENCGNQWYLVLLAALVLESFAEAIGRMSHFLRAGMLHF